MNRRTFNQLVSGTLLCTVAPITFAVARPQQHIWFLEPGQCPPDNPPWRNQHGMVLFCDRNGGCEIFTVFPDRPEDFLGHFDAWTYQLAPQEKLSAWTENGMRRMTYVWV